jgi:hypothetical protein
VTSCRKHSQTSQGSAPGSELGCGGGKRGGIATSVLDQRDRSEGCSGEYVMVELLAEVERGRKRLPREMADDECDRQTDEEDMNDQLG